MNHQLSGKTRRRDLCLPIVVVGAAIKKACHTAPVLPGKYPHVFWNIPGRNGDDGVSRFVSGNPKGVVSRHFNPLDSLSFDGGILLCLKNMAPIAVDFTDLLQRLAGPSSFGRCWGNFLDVEIY